MYQRQRRYPPQSSEAHREASKYIRKGQVQKAMKQLDPNKKPLLPVSPAQFARLEDKHPQMGFTNNAIPVDPRHDNAATRVIVNENNIIDAIISTRTDLSTGCVGWTIPTLKRLLGPDVLAAHPLTFDQNDMTQAPNKKQ